MEKEIIKPSYTIKPDSITKMGTSDFYIFNCIICKEEIHLYYDKQIECTNGYINLTKAEYNYLKKYYNIGYVNKSHDGGFPVFDKICCEKCNTNYFTYVGVKEPLNSVYHIQVQGIMMEK